LGRLVLADENAARETRPLLIGEGVGLVSRRSCQLGRRGMASGWLVSGRTGVRAKVGNRSAGLLAATDSGVAAWNADADGGGKPIDAITDHGKPSAGIQQIGDGIADVGELQSLYRAIIRRLDHSFVFKDKRVSGSLRQAIGQRDADRRILADAL